MARAVGLICFAAAPVAAEAQTYTWSGAVTAGPHDWTVDANWSGTPNAVPGLTSADDVANLTANWTAAPTINLNSVVTLEGCVVADPNGRSLSSADRLIVVGPEGGFSTDELASATTVSLGESILRAETAAIVAGALMVNMARG